jgi:hypothetical protein
MPISRQRNGDLRASWDVFNIDTASTDIKVAAKIAAKCAASAITIDMNLNRSRGDSPNEGED